MATKKTRESPSVLVPPVSALRLADIYKERPSRNEMLWEFVSRSEYDDQFFRIVVVNPVEIFETWRDASGEHLAHVYQQHATPEQRSLVASYRKQAVQLARKHYLVVDDQLLLDGHHRVVAMAKAKIRQALALDLSKPEEDEEVHPRNNPLPPPFPINNRRREIEHVLRHVREQRVDPRRVGWALGRCVEDVYNEAERRGLMPDDVVLELLSALRDYCIESDRDSHDRSVEAASELMKRASQPDSPYGDVYISPAFSVGNAAWWLCFYLIGSKSGAGSFEYARDTARHCVDAWIRMGESVHAARTRVLRQFLHSLRT